MWPSLVALGIEKIKLVCLVCGSVPLLKVASNDLNALIAA